MRNCSACPLSILPTNQLAFSETLEEVILSVTHYTQYADTPLTVTELGYVDKILTMSGSAAAFMLSCANFLPSLRD